MGIKPIYLDYNASTPVDSQVLEYMLPFFSVNYGNASSRQHAYGWTAAAAVDLARESVAHLIHAAKEEIYFTSGATESINLAMRGVFSSYSYKGKHIITCLTEHPAVLDTCQAIENLGAEITYLPVNDKGHIDLNQLESEIRSNTIMVCLMAANNETGVLHPLKAISRLCRENGILFFTDATQTAGKIPIDVEESGIDLLALSAHKFYGPKGCGALYIRRKNPRVSLLAEITGGKQEKNMRSGTLNVPGIAGIGKASDLAMISMHDEGLNIEKMRNDFEATLSNAIQGFSINGDTHLRLPGVSNICLQGVRASEIMLKCPGLAIASGSACASADPEPSHVLKAMNRNDLESASSLRISLGRFTTENEISDASQQIISAYRELSIY